VINAKVASLPDGAMGFDITTPLTAVSAHQYRSKGYGFVVRYIGRGDGSHTFVDISQAEAQIIVNAGLGLCVVQHPLAAGWSPSAQRGQQFGEAAAGITATAGLLHGTTVWLDLEGVVDDAEAQDVIDYCNAWHDAVAAAGFTPGVYIGASPGLTADEIYWDLRMQSYWRGGSSAAAGVPTDIPHRGYQMVQRITGTGNSEFDSDVIRTDNFGGKVRMCVAR
jgi:hypothetical protein